MNPSEDYKRSWPYTPTDNPPPLTSCMNTSQPLQISWEQESVNFDKNELLSLFICNICMKTFYNKNALLNHKNMTHDILNEETLDSNIHVILEQELKTCYGFKFIPINPEENSGCEIVSRTFTEDTSYLIVRADCDDSEIFPKDRKGRLDSNNSVKKTLQSTDKAPTVDIRGPFTCTLPSTMCPDLQCQQIFFNCCEYSVHYREEHTKRRKAALRCQVCEKRLDREPDDTDRMVAAAVHAANSQPLIFPCRICGIQFSNLNQFEEHNRLVHAKMKPHQCTICFKRFAQLGGLQQHLRMHTGIRPFMCTFCPKAFTQKAGLDQHLRIHTKVKPFKCVLCSKCFSQSVHLRQHMRTHTNIQPFECSVCNKRFKQRSHLNFHLKSHMNEASLAAAERYEEAMRLQKTPDLFDLTHLHQVDYVDEFASKQQRPSTVSNTSANQLKSVPEQGKENLYNLTQLHQVQNEENFYYAREIASKQFPDTVLNKSTNTNPFQPIPVDEAEKDNQESNLPNPYVNQSLSLPVIVADDETLNRYVRQPQSVPVVESNNQFPNRYVPSSLSTIVDGNLRNPPNIHHDSQSRSLPVIEDDDNINSLPNNGSPTRSLQIIKHEV